MANDTAKTITTNFLPVQGTFEPLPPYEIISFIGPGGTEFYAPINPNVDGVNITNSTINSTTIGLTTPAAAAFTTASATNLPVGANDLTNKTYVDAALAGISWKEPVLAATTANITLSGAQTIDTVAVVAGDRVLVKDQTNAAENGIYIVAAGAWSRSDDTNTWDELVSALVFVTSGGLAGSAWYCYIQPGGTLGTTDITWSNFQVAGAYFAGTGLSLAANTFSLDVPVTAANGGTGQTSYATGDLLYASGSTALSKLALGSYQRILTAGISAPEWTLPANVSVGNAEKVTITPTSTNTNFYLAFAFGSGSNYVQIDGGGNATYNPSTNTLTVPNFVGALTGNASTATSATTATNLAGGANGSVPYQTGSGATTFLSAGSDGQVLTLASGIPSWATPTVGDVVGPASSTDNALAKFDGTTGKVIQNSAITLSDAGALQNVNEINFDTTPTGVVGGAGSMSWNSDDNAQTLDLVMAGGNVTMQVGEEIYYRVKASSAITNGQVVMFTGTLGASGGLTAAPATGLTAATGSYIMGVATEDIALNGWGYVTSFGMVRGIDTTGSASSETWADGDILYYNPSVTGGLTKTVPDAPNAKVQVAAVVYADANGSLFVRSTFEPRFNDLSDVYVPSPSDGDVVIWSNINSRWENTAQSNLSVFSASNLDGGDAGYLPYQNATGETTFLATGSDGQVLKLASGVPTWSSDASGVTISDDTTTNATRYLTFVDVTTGNATTEYVSSTKLTFNPSTGNFGIGTSSPSYKLHVVGSGTGARARIESTSTANGQISFVNTSTSSTGFVVGLINDASGDAIIYHQDAKAIRFYTSSAERMLIDGSGNVGIGTSSPSSYTNQTTLSINGTTYGRLDLMSGGSVRGSFYGGSSGPTLASSGANPFSFETNGAERMRLSASGGLSVGTTTDPGAGAIYATGNITAYYSDDRLKTKLGGIENALDKVCALSGFYYEANETAQALGYEAVREVGVSAQEVQAVMPEVVKPAPIDQQYLTVDYERLVPLLIESIKELRAEIKALKGE